MAYHDNGMDVFVFIIIVIIYQIISRQWNGCVCIYYYCYHLSDHITTMEWICLYLLLLLSFIRFINRLFRTLKAYVSGCSWHTSVCLDMNNIESAVQC